jgi:CBS domain-containing protein
MEVKGVTELKNKLTAGDIMTSSVQTVAAGESLVAAMAIMDRDGFSQVPVMEGAKPVALLTETDVRRALAAGRQDRPVADLASPLPETVEPQARLSSVLELVQQQEVVLVVTADGDLAGIITYWDVIVLARPALMVKEVELILRRVVAAAYAAKYGPDWWPQVPADLRQQAEQEHRSDEDTAPATPEHMLGHTSLWALIEIFRKVRPDLGDDRFQLLHQVRQFRNKVAHLYVLTDAEQRRLTALCREVGGWLVTLLPADDPLAFDDEA